MPEKPKTVDLTSSSTCVFLRRDIISIPDLDESGNETESTHWQYEEAKLTIAEYEEYMASVQSPSTQLIMQTLSDLQLQIDEL